MLQLCFHWEYYHRFTITKAKLVDVVISVYRCKGSDFARILPEIVSLCIAYKVISELIIVLLLQFSDVMLNKSTNVSVQSATFRRSLRVCSILLV